jgi:hypothetical protein
VRDELLRRLADRVRDFDDGGSPDVVLDETSARLATELTGLAGESSGEPRVADADILHTLAAFYWARSLASSATEVSAADHERSMHFFGMLFLVDHRRVPRELWSRLTRETGHDPWQDPVVHASDLISDAKERGDPTVIGEAVALLQGAAATPTRDSALGLALIYRSVLVDRPIDERLADADSSIELFAGLASLDKASPPLRARRLVDLASAHMQRFTLLSDDDSDLQTAETIARGAC